MIRTRDILCMLIGAVLGTIAVSRAVDLELAIGRSEFCCKTDGIWWQSPFGFTGSTRDLSFEIGARQKVGPISLHAAYLDLGSATGANVATMRDDDYGKYNTSKGCITATQKNCLGYFGVSQHVAGVLAGAAFGHAIKGILLEGEIGQYFYKSDINVSIWCPNCGVAQRYAFGAGGTFSYASDIRHSSYVAIKAAYKNAFLTYRRFNTIDGSGSGGQGVEAQFSTALTNGPVNQIMVGVTL